MTTWAPLSASIATAGVRPGEGGICSADARGLALGFAPGPDVKAVAAMLSHHLELWATKPGVVEPGAPRRITDVFDTVQTAADAAQAHLHVPVVVLFSPTLPTLP